MKLARRWKLAYLALVLLFTAGCASTSSGIKPFPDMNHQERAAYFQEWYIKVYDDTMSMGKTPGLTVGQVTVYRKKKELLSHVYPLIQAYKMIVDRDGVPTQEREQEIFDFINALATLGG